MFTIVRKAIILPDFVSCAQVSLKENIWLDRALRDGLRKRWVNCYGCLELDVGGRELGCQNTSGRLL